MTETIPVSATSTLGPIALGAIFVVLGIVLLLTGACSGFWAMGFGCVVLGIAAKMSTLANYPTLTWRGDRKGWALLGVGTGVGVALVAVGITGVTSVC